MKNISFRKRNVQGGSVYQGNTLWLGARRLCKTFLVDQALRGKITFRHAGLSPVDEAGKKNLMPEQLKQMSMRAETSSPIS